VPRTTLPAVLQVLLTISVVASSARAQTTDARGDLSQLSLPVSLREALVAADDQVPGDRSQFLLELIRRIYNTPITVKNVKRDSLLQSILASLDPAKRPAASTESPTTLPLPMPESTWTDVVFAGRSSAATLARDIVQSRGASLFYYGALSLDNETRAWLSTERDLVTLIVAQHPASFAAAAPALRVADRRVRVPGGERAESGWEALVGARVGDPVGFVRALLLASEGRLAHWFGATALLTPAQVDTLLSLEVSDASSRIGVARRLHAIFERIGTSWRVEERAFGRPPVDPILLVADLPADERGRPVVPGSAKFWTSVFAAGDYVPAKTETGGGESASAEPLAFITLCEQVFSGDRLADRRRYQLVMVASRVVKAPSSDAIETMRAAMSHPALIAALERGGLEDVAAYAHAARRAVALTAVGDDDRGVRALTQFQGALAMLVRAAIRGGLDSDALARLVTSLSALEFSNRGDYEGKVVAWLDETLRAAAKSRPLAVLSGPMENDAVVFVAGPVGDVRVIEWEGTRYRIDFSRAEAVRMAKLLGEQARPFLTSARTFVAVARAVAESGATREQLQREVDRFKQAGAASALDTPSAWTDEGVPKRYKDAVAALQRAAGGDRAATSKAPEAIKLLADDLTARGLKEIVYAIALGQPERMTISAGDAAERHDFSMRLANRRLAPWNLPVVGADPWRGWHVVGSILGLDVQLADFAQQRVSMRPPKSKPTLDDDQRRLLIETMAIVAPARLTDTDRDAIAGLIEKGRARLAAVRNSTEAIAIADEIRLSPARRTLLPWVVANDPERVGAFLGPAELLWLGLEKAPVAASLDAWGAPAEPRLGCLCLQLLDRRPWEMFAGRWQSGIFNSAFPDLNLRLAEMLAQLKMPGALLAPVLTAATPDLTEISTPRDHDDRRALVEAVQALKIERLEQYLALLTSDGPLVPVDTSAESAGEHRPSEVKPGEVRR
jgi:hypothetical protein